MDSECVRVRRTRMDLWADMIDAQPQGGAEGMKQIKMFNNLMMKELGLEDRVNKWLSEHPGINVVDIKFQAERDKSGNDRAFIAIIYETEGTNRNAHNHM